MGVRIALAAAASVVMTATAFAQTAPVAATPASVQRNFEVDYGIHLGMMGEVGEARLRINTNGPNYAATLNRQAIGVARWAVGNGQDYSQISRGQITEQGVQPSSYERKGGKRGRIVRVAFTGSDVVTTATPALGSMGNPPASRAQRLEAMDDVSAFVSMIYAVGPGDPCARTVKIFDGRQRYDLAMRPNGAVRVNVNGFRGEGRRCSVTYRALAGFTDPVTVSGPLTFVFAPVGANAWAPTRVEMVMDDGGVAVLEAKRVSSR